MVNVRVSILLTLALFFSLVNVVACGGLDITRPPEPHDFESRTVEVYQRAAVTAVVGQLLDEGYRSTCVNVVIASVDRTAAATTDLQQVVWYVVGTSEWVMPSAEPERR